MAEQDETIQNGQPIKGGNRRAILLGSLRRGSSIVAACGAALVSRQTFYNWKRDEPGFADAVELARSGAASEIEDIVVHCAKLAKTDAKYQTSLIFYCKARLGWKDTGVVADETPAGETGETSPIDHDAMTDEQLDAYIARLQAIDAGGAGV